MKLNISYNNGLKNAFKLNVFRKLERSKTSYSKIKQLIHNFFDLNHVNFEKIGSEKVKIQCCEKAFLGGWCGLND